MYQAKKDEQWYFGMTLHVGVDADSDVIQSINETSADVHDGNCIANLLHGEERSVCGDQSYSGRSDVIAAHAPNAKDLTNRRVRWRLANGCAELPQARAAANRRCAKG